LDKRKIADILTKEIKQEQINIDEPMKKHTSFKIGGNADIFVKIHTIEELKYVIKISKIEEIPLTVIGNGSNILVRDNGIRGIVVKLEFNQIMIDGTVVTVGAGVKLGELGQRLLQKEITGFEFASGIPGTIGGAVRMNAGAYGGEMKDIIIETKCFDIEQYEKEIQEEKSSGTKCNKSKASEVIVLANEEQEFSYRHSIFMNKKYIIGIATGVLLLILAIPLGELYGKAYITIGNGMAVEQYIMLMKRAIVSFQIVGGLISGLSGLAGIFSKKIK